MAVEMSQWLCPSAPSLSIGLLGSTQELEITNFCKMSFAFHVCTMAYVCPHLNFE